MHLSKYMKATIATTVLLATGAIYLEKTFLAFLIGWIVVIPIAACGFLAYGLIQYRKQTKNSIVISVKPNSVTERYAELIRKEEQIRREKEILYKELTNGNKKGL